MNRLARSVAIGGECGRCASLHEPNIEETIFGPNPAELTRTLNNLGLVLMMMGDLDEARQHLNRAADILGSEG